MVKGIRWKKGQSSTSNPSCKKHRNATKNSFQFGFFSNSSNKGESQLTAKALAELDNGSTSQRAMDSMSVFSDSDSINSFKSWATNWSDCTNATFNKIHKYWNSNSALHKEVLAVLATVTEVIKENDGKESETEYFAALLTGLESIEDNEESATAFLYLIALAIKKVPVNLLQAKHSSILKTLMNPLNKFGSKTNNAQLIKSSLMCICWLLKSLDDREWKNNEIMNAYVKILSFTNNSKPKIRKCGHGAVQLILNSYSSSNSNIYKKLSNLTAEYCMSLLTNTKDTENEPESEMTKKQPESRHQTILHTLSLVKNIIHHFQLDHLRAICEDFLKLMTFKDIIVNSSCFQIFYQLFIAETNHIDAELNAQLLNAFYDNQPSFNDPQQLIGWLAIMKAAIISLNRLDRQLCLAHLPNISQVFMSILSNSHYKNVHVMTTNNLCHVLEQCVQTNMDILIENMKENPADKSVLGKMFTFIENGLSYQYHSVWVFVMKILACAFTCFKSAETFPIVSSCLSSLANLRESKQFDYKAETDFAIGKAIKTYGPKLILESIPLGINGDETVYDYPRSWMLPLLKDNIEKTEIAYFANTFMPLAFRLRTKSEEFSANKRLIEAKIFFTIQSQIWSLLPGFCNYPTDFNETFKKIAKTLSEVIEKYKDLRPSILHALRTLINRNSDENKALMGKYAKNYLPILFNIYTTEIMVDDDSNRQSLLDTIKCYFKITDKDLINNYLSLAIENYEKNTNLYNNSKNTETSKDNKVKFDFDKMDRDAQPDKITSNAYLFARHSFLDLIGIMVTYANQQVVQKAYQLARISIEDKLADRTIQKKSYKILDFILQTGTNEENPNNDINSFIDNNLPQIFDLLLKSIANTAPGAKYPRLKCILHLIEKVKQPEQKQLLKQILPEVILCVKEVNTKARETAFTLISAFLRAWQRADTNSAQPVSEIDSLNEFFHFVMIGLGGSTQMVSCTCLALTTLTSDFRENISGSLITDLIEAACLLIKSQHKETVVSSLALLKVLCSIFTQSIIAQYLDQICDLVIYLNEKHPSASDESVSVSMNSQRVKGHIKLILKKLMKKFSYEILHEKLFAFEKSKTTSDSKTGMIVENQKETRSLTKAARQGLENLLSNLKKDIENDKKRKLESKGKSGETGDNAGNDLISNYTAHKSVVNNEIEELLRESDSEEENDNKSAKTSATQKTKKSTKSTKEALVAKRAAKAAKKNDSLAWLQENEEDDPLDLLDPMAIKRVLATKPLTKEEIVNKKKRELASKSSNRGFKMSSDGKLVIDDDDEEETQGKKKQGKKKGDDLDEMMDTLSLSKMSTKSSRKSMHKKRSLGDDNDSDDEVMDRFSYRSGGTGIHRKVSSNKKPTDAGSEYRAKKSKGDVKLKNKLDPYAYIPLNFAKLNRRKNKKLQGDFKGVVRAGQTKPEKRKKF